MSSPSLLSSLDGTFLSAIGASPDKRSKLFSPDDRREAAIGLLNLEARKPVMISSMDTCSTDSSDMMGALAKVVGEGCSADDTSVWMTNEDEA